MPVIWCRTPEGQVLEDCCTDVEPKSACLTQSIEPRPGPESKKTLTLPLTHLPDKLTQSCLAAGRTHLVPK